MTFSEAGPTSHLSVVENPPNPLGGLGGLAALAISSSGYKGCFGSGARVGFEGRGPSKPDDAPLRPHGAGHRGVDPASRTAAARPPAVRGGRRRYGALVHRAVAVRALPGQCLGARHGRARHPPAAV